MSKCLQMRLFWVVAMCLWAVEIDPVTAQLPACADRPTHVELPRIDTSRFCLELVIEDRTATPSELGFTALATDPDGTLYAARPLTGEVFALTDTNADGLPESSRQIINGLMLPNSLTYHDDALYIAGGSTISRWQLNTGLETLVDNLSTGTGFWTGGITIGDDNRLYVGTGAACDTCSPLNGHGLIFSYTLKGQDQRIAASGFRQPNGIAWYQGGLWVTDTARDAFDSGAFDELNRVEVDDSSKHYGFPYCIGIENTPDALFSDTDCSAYTPPMFTFPTHSTPLAVTAYQGAAFPDLQGTLLTVLSGAYNESRIRGYSVVAVRVDADGNPLNDAPIFPTTLAPVEQYELLGVYPHHLYGVTVSPEGWIYISVGGSRIYALRPL